MDFNKELLNSKCKSIGIDLTQIQLEQFELFYNLLIA